jgi:hypothetical protein
MRAAPIASATSDLIVARELAREDTELTHADRSEAIASGALCVATINA